MDTTTSPLASIGIDIGKEVFHLVGFGTDGKIAFRRKIKRLALIETFKKLPPCVVGMEACLSATSSAAPCASSAMNRASFRRST
jgi:transposase